jgi:hypothetical protein
LRCCWSLSLVVCDDSSASLTIRVVISSASSGESAPLFQLQLPLFVGEGVVSVGGGLNIPLPQQW